MPSAALAERIAHYLERPAPAAFDELAAELGRELHRRDSGFRELCRQAGLGDQPPGDWRAVPAAPAPRVSSGGAGALTRQADERAFQSACPESDQPLPILNLIPADGTEAAREQASAGARIVDRYGAPGSSSAVAGDRIDIGAARSWLAGRQRDRRVAIALTTRASLERLLGALARQDLRFQLTPGSRIVVMDAYGSSGDDPVGRCAEHLGLPPQSLVVRLAWAGVPTPLYGQLTDRGALTGVPSPWTRIRALDPGTFHELPEGRQGRLSVLDLTIDDRPFHLLTASLGTVANGTIRVDLAARPES